MKLRTIILVFILGLIKTGITQNLDWVQKIGSIGEDISNSIAIDSHGNVYVAGSFEQTVDFDPSPNVYDLQSEGYFDIFITKFDPSGNFVWAKSFGGIYDDKVMSIALDNYGNIIIAGIFSDTVDFDPGLNNYILSTDNYNSVFISKLDPLGNFIWAKQFESTYYNYVSKMILDDFGNIYTTGSFNGTIDCDPSFNTFNLYTIGNEDVFITKLDATGNFEWAKQVGGVGIDVGTSIDIDASGNLYTIGYFSNTVDFDPGVGVFNLTSIFVRDMFVLKLDNLGNFIWAKQIESTTNGLGYDIAVDDIGNQYITGRFQGTIDFDPGIGIYNLNVIGNNFIDAFILKLDSFGNFIWAKQLGGSNHCLGTSITLNNSGNIYITGIFDNIVDFDPGSGIFSLTSAGYNDIFISILDTSGDFVWAKQLGGTAYDFCASIKVDYLDNIYTTGNFNGTSDFDPGASVYNLSSSSSSKSDVFIHKMTPCTNTTGIDTQIACNTFTWIDGNTYTENNITATYNILSGSSIGCDSLVTLNLTINNVSDLSTQIVGNTIIANNNSASYQWLNCDNNFSIIPGETNQTFIPSLNVFYAIELEENGCVDTSNCVVISTVDVVENSSVYLVNAFPNPTSGLIHFPIENQKSLTYLTIQNSLGEEIFSNVYTSVSQIDLFLDYPSGIYFVKIFNENGSYYLKVLKE
jgi:hypothetical protein